MAAAAALPDRIQRPWDCGLLLNSGGDRKVHMVAAEELCDGREIWHQVHLQVLFAAICIGPRRHGSVGDDSECTRFAVLI